VGVCPWWGCWWGDPLGCLVLWLGFFYVGFLVLLGHFVCCVVSLGSGVLVGWAGCWFYFWWRVCLLSWWLVCLVFCRSWVDLVGSFGLYCCFSWFVGLRIPFLGVSGSAGSGGLGPGFGGCGGGIHWE